MDAKAKFQEIFRLLIDEGKEIDVPVFGLSMFPFFLPGTIVRIAPAKWEELKIGNVVLFKRDEQYVLHRLIISNGSFKQTKGDSLVYFDTPMKESHYIGKVVAYYRGKKIRTCNSLSFMLWSKIILHGHFILGYLFHFFSLVWYKFIGSKRVL